MYYVMEIILELKNLSIFEKSSISILNPMTKIIMRGFDSFPYHKGKIYTIVNNMVEKANTIPKRINYLNTTIINSNEKLETLKTTILNFNDQYFNPIKVLKACNTLKEINYLYHEKINNEIIKGIINKNYLFL